MLKFFKRSKGSKKNNSKSEKLSTVDHQQLPLLTPSVLQNPPQQLNSTMYFDHNDDHTNNAQQQNFITQQHNINSNRNLFKNKSKKSSSIPNNENSSRNIYDNYFQRNRAPQLPENEPLKKLKSTKNFENLIDSGSRNEFVDQRKRFKYNAADLATNPATNTIASTNDSYSTIQNYANNGTKNLHLNNNNFNNNNNNNNSSNKNLNYKSDFLDNNCENLKSKNLSKQKYSNSSVVDDLSLPSTSSHNNKKFGDKNYSDTNKKKSVKFSNPIDKGRDFFNNIMAKGRNRNKNNNITNNNQYNQQQDTNHHQVIMSNLPEYHYPKETNNYNSKGISNPIYNNNSNQNENFNQNNNNNENDFINFGYQITRSKNSPDIFKKIKNSHNFESSDDDVIDHDQDIYMSRNLQRRGEADGSDTNITNPNYHEYSANSNNNNFLYNYNNDVDDDDVKLKRDWNTDTDTDIFEEHPPVFSKRMPLPHEENGKDIRKPKSILKNSHQHRNNQWYNNNDDSVTKSIPNEQDHKKYVRYSSLNPNHLNNNEEIEKLSELTECDRDSFIKNHKTGVPSSLYMKMGQSQAKTPSEQHRNVRSRSISPPPSTSTTPCPNIFSSSSNDSYAGTSSMYQQPDIFDYNLPPIVSEPLSPSYDKSRQSDKYENIPLPKITVDDFSKKSAASNTSTSPTDSESDIFYDFEAPPPARSPPRYPSAPPTPTTFLEDIVEEDEDNQDDDEWHFVSNKNIGSTSSSRKQSPITKDTEFTSDMSSSTTSSSSMSSSASSNKNSKDYHRRNHFIDNLIDSDLNDSGFISPSESNSGKVLIINSCDLLNDRDDNEFSSPNNTNKLNSKMQGDFLNTISNNLNIFEQINHNSNDSFSVNHILIDSISLPDVVVESKILENSTTDKKLNLDIPEFVGESNRNKIINNNDINKSHSTGNVHFIPIHVEREENYIHIEEIKTTLDDNKSTENNDNLRTKSTSDCPTKEMRDLINQEATINAKLEEAEKSAFNAQQKANELEIKITDLENDLSTKSWNIERLEAELQSIYKEDDSVRKRLKFLEKEKETIKQKFNDQEDELNRKYDNLEQQYKELEEKYQQLRALATSLQTQLAAAQADAEECRLEKDKLCEEKDGQLKFLQDNLDLARQERQEVEEKWQKEFETLRNQNQNREDNLMTDCEWKLRTMQKNCKDKIDKAEKIRNETVKRADALEELVQSKSIDEARFKNLQAEVRQLRGLTNDQRTSLNLMHEQIEDLKAELEATNAELERQIEEVQRIKLSCQNELGAKDRETIQKIYDATQELADIWEQKLLTEMTRLTHELETVHVEERLDDMSKLQTEHVEELKVLTIRYTENEQELRDQVAELSDQLKSKCDVAFNTRIHLDRADRDYQIAMSREEEKREYMIEQLQKEFEQEKSDMEENYCTRLGEVKNKFAKELANTTEEIAKRHRQQLEQQWDQLVAEKEEALQALESRHRIRIEDQEAKIRELDDCYGNLEVQHQRDMKDLKNAYDLDRSSLQTRDINNAQEIDQLHRKCRCLTNLFEEMRMRYERREPRQEDLREIAELRSRCESQERDLCVLTEQLRDMQINMEEMSSDTAQQQKMKKSIRKPPPKSIPTNCDVIYEENEEREQSPIESTKTSGDDSSSDEEDEHNDDE